jgi:hypothetical protein
MGTAEKAGFAVECSHLLPLNREFLARNFLFQAAAQIAEDAIERWRPAVNHELAFA